MIATLQVEACAARLREARNQARQARERATAARKEAEALELHARDCADALAQAVDALVG